MPRRRSAGPALLTSPEFVELALVGVEREIAETRKRLSTLEAYAAELRRHGRGGAAMPALEIETSAVARPRRKRRMSAEARKRLSERMRKRWAEYRKAKAAEQKHPPRGGRGKAAGAAARKEGDGASKGEA